MTSILSQGKNRVLSKIGLILVPLALCACSNVKPAEIASCRPLPQNLPLPAPLNLTEITWAVESGSGEPKFILTAKGYESLSRNTAELYRWISEAKAQLIYYTGALDPKGERNGRTADNPN
ncbi:hypothetical protein KPP23_009 [Pseudomonas phage KPP23]|nr:hypothetical protein KPP23_009 [Pseudomonas phage KPP23]